MDGMMHSSMNMTGGDENGEASDDSSFCNGPGYVMNSGFQLSKGGYCVLFLFQGAVVDTAMKYGFCLLGSLLLGVTVELLRVLRTFASKKNAYSFTRNMPLTVHDALLAFLFGVQMMAAYWLMLLVMIYEYVIFIFVLLGLSLGHFMARKIERAYLTTFTPSSVGSLNLAAGGEGGQGDTETLHGSPCCGYGGVDVSGVTVVAGPGEAHKSILPAHQQHQQQQQQQHLLYPKVPYTTMRNETNA